MGFYMVDKSFSSWAKSFSGCDGGDIGAPESPSIWFCGIEWGGGHKNDKGEFFNKDELLKMFSESRETPPLGFKDWVDRKGVSRSAWEENVAYIFNWRAMKLLSALNGGDVGAYKAFAESTKPFIEGAKGYFKMNIYPLAFRNTSHSHWQKSFAEATGFLTKNEYKEWIKNNRFPIMRGWTKTHKPKIIICTGITYIEEFCAAFAVDIESLNVKNVKGLKLHWVKNEDGVFVFVIPFMVNRYGLTRDDSIQAFGELMREITESEIL